MIKETGKKLKLIFSRTFLLYLAGALVIVFSTNMQGMFSLIKLRTLNRLMPPLEYLAQDEAAVPEGIWEDYRYYYGKITDYLPGLPNAYHLLGYSHYRLGDHDSAIAAYKKSIELNSYFLWSHYNLGLLQYKKKDYEAALKSFETAIETKLKVNVRIIMLSKVYQQIIASNDISNEEIINNFQQGLKDSAVMRLKCLFELGRYPEVMSLAAKILSLNWDTQGRTRYYAGLAALRMNNIPLSIYYLRECVDNNPDFAEGFLYLSKLLAETSESELPKTLILRAKYLEDQGVSPLKRPFRLRVY